MKPTSLLLTDQDLHLFNEGSHLRLYEKLGAHPCTWDGTEGTYFAVWAPSAERVCVVGDFNSWDRARHPLQPRANSGIWEGFVPGAGQGAHYKYHVASRAGAFAVDKADPFAFRHETPPTGERRCHDHPDTDRLPMGESDRLFDGMAERVPEIEFPAFALFLFVSIDDRRF